MRCTKPCVFVSIPDDVMFYLIIFFGILSAVSGAKTKSDSLLKICAVQGSPHTIKECAKLSAAKRSKASCVFAPDRLSCLRLVSKRKADFTLLEAEDLVFATGWEDSAVLVVSEMRSIKAMPWQYGAVVVVRNSLNVTSVEDLRGTKLCHPGVGSADSLFLQYLEERLAGSECDANLPTYEDRVKTTANFFSAACKAGAWAEDAEEDARLKTEYENLCSLCENPDSCSKRDKYWGSGGSATCFQDGVGDVLWAKHSDIKRFFKVDPDEPGFGSEYSFLCDDGSLMPLTTEEPCLWMARPWQVVAANLKSVTDVQKLMERLQDDNRDEWLDSLMHVMEFYMKHIVNLSGKTPEDYLKTVPGYLVASTMSQPRCRPRKSLRWCVSTVEEEQKCVWLAKVAKAFSIQPEIDCVAKTGNGCVGALQKAEADVTVVRPEDVLAAVTRHGLVSLLQEEPRREDQAYLLYAVAKQSSIIKKWSDLKHRKVCFPQKDGLAWSTAITSLGACSVEQVFSSVCVPEENAEACCHIRSADVDANVLRCLMEDVCEVAFIDINTLYRYTDGNSSEPWAADARLSDFRTVCRKDKTSECPWTWSAQGHVMVSSNMSVTLQQDAINALLKISSSFGRPIRSTDLSDPAFEVFGVFFEQNNILFQDTSIALVTQTKSVRPHPYEQIVQAVRTCSQANSILSMPLLVLLISTLMLIRQ